jgi:hypothetical protein
MSKWEYHVVSFEAGDDRFNAVTIQTILNQLGAETWKIAAITPLLSASTPTAVNSEQSSSGAAVTRAVMVTLKRRLRKPSAGKRV